MKNKIRIKKSPEIILKKQLKDNAAEISSIKADNDALRKVIEEYKLNDLYVRSLIHELKNINRDLKYDTDDLEFDDMSPDERNLWSQSNLLSIVMNTYGFQYNQESDKGAFKRPIPLYKKVDKLRKCYNYRRNSDFAISITGTSIMGFRATEIIEALFYILIENARKYSLTSKKLNVNFREDDSTIYVSFSNICELPDRDEIHKLTEMGYRGKNKTRDGKGIGLATFASICDTYGIDYKISIIENGISSNQKPKGTFKVEMVFHDCEPINNGSYIKRC